MFRLSDRSRRRLGLTLFVLLCAVPTALVLIGGIARHLPQHVCGEQQRLSFCFGRTVTLGGVRHPRPGVIVYEQLRCLDPASGEALLKCEEVRVERTRGTTAASRPLLKITAARVEIDATSDNRLWPLLERFLAQGPNAAPFDIQWSVADVAISGQSTCFPLANVHGNVTIRPDGTRAEVLFRVGAEETANPIRIRVAQDRQVNPAVLGFDVETGEGSVPCELLGLAVAPMRRLGESCRFDGYFWANHALNGWEGELSGRLADVDLDRLVTDRLPHLLSGTAEVMLQKVRFRAGRIEQAAGTLSAARGKASRSLAESAIRRLDVWVVPPMSGPAQLIKFDELAFAFHLDAGGVWLQGRCPSGPTGTILLGTHGHQFGSPPDGPKPVADLIGMLAGQQHDQVPAAPQTAWLLSRLPAAEEKVAEEKVSGPVFR